MSAPTPQPDEANKGKQRRKHRLSLFVTPLADVPHWGERLLPYLYMAMESCWVGAIFIGLASLNFSQSHDLLMPLWSPFVLMGGAYWLSSYIERRDIAQGRETSGEEVGLSSSSSLMYGLIALFTLLVIWSSVYASIPLYNPGWVSALLNDLLSLNATAFRVALVLALAIYFCWRGLRLARRLIEPADVFSTLRLGIGVIIAVLVIRIGAGSGFFGESLLLLLIPLFLAFTLLAHALAKALFIRRFHPIGLQGSIAAQERSLLLVSSAIGLLLILIAVLVGTFASPTFLIQVQAVLAPVGQVYDLLISGIAYAFVFLVTPLFWLLTVLHFRTPNLPVRPFRPIQQPVGHLPSKQSLQTPESVLVAIGILKILVPVLFVVLMIILIRLALRRRRVLLNRRSADQYESVWSWELFVTQLKALLRALWLRFFPQRQQAAPRSNVEAITGEPTARSIREMYRVFLQWAALRGYPRKKEETPYEFQHRLNAQLPVITAEVRTITDDYTAIRYGGAIPDEADVARVQQNLSELQQRSL